jgi:protein-tyrosine-phosphatase
MLLSRVLLAALLVGACDRGASTAPASATSEASMHPTIVQSIESYVPSITEIPDERRETLDRIATFVRAQRAKSEPVKLTFICTGNSRRSHMGQLWAAAAARYYGIDGVETYSGGTEPSAFNPRTIAAIERVGFVVEPRVQSGDNPRYRVAFADGVPPVEAFSKRYDDPVNPKTGFVAVMTCSEADEGCPFIPGAALRVSLAYEDPRLADGTPHETARYDERSRQIATEMLYLFSRVADA